MKKKIYIYIYIHIAKNLIGHGINLNKVNQSNEPFLFCVGKEKKNRKKLN